MYVTWHWRYVISIFKNKKWSTWTYSRLQLDEYGANRTFSQISVFTSWKLFRTWNHSINQPKGFFRNIFQMFLIFYHILLPKFLSLTWMKTRTAGFFSFQKSINIIVSCIVQCEYHQDNDSHSYLPFHDQNTSISQFKKKTRVILLHMDY